MDAYVDTHIQTYTHLHIRTSTSMCNGMGMLISMTAYIWASMFVPKSFEAQSRKRVIKTHWETYAQRLYKQSQDQNGKRQIYLCSIYWHFHCCVHVLTFAQYWDYLRFLHLHRFADVPWNGKMRADILGGITVFERPQKQIFCSRGCCDK